MSDVLPVIKNARITSTMLGIEDHGIMTAFVYLDYDGASQGFGGYSLDGPTKDAEGRHTGRVGSAFGCEFIRCLLATVGVESWEKLPGTPVRVQASHSKVDAIGHFLKEQWLDPKVLAKRMEK